MHTVDSGMLAELRARTYPAGTVIFPKVGGAVLTNKKRILGVEATFDNNVMGLIPTRVEGRWLYYFMRTLDLRTLANTQALPSIKQSRVAAQPLPLPPLAEQRRIAAILDEQMAAVERARAAAEAQVAAARALPAAYLRAVFESDEARGWPTRRVGDLCARIDYGFTAGADRTVDEPRFLRITDIQDGEVNWSAVPGCRISPSAEAGYRLADGDIVFARTGGTTGKSYLIRTPPRAVFAS
ncbi:MAG TPA: restriction endonuclease subunit S [Dehalococcoidia bacterium]|nr:restriction endonuclease subunit S [Dehalococcoidia bacterium]